MASISHRLATGTWAKVSPILSDVKTKVTSSVSLSVAIAEKENQNKQIIDKNLKVLEEDLKKGGTTTIGQLAAMTCAQVV